MNVHSRVLQSGQIQFFTDSFSFLFEHFGLLPFQFDSFYHQRNRLTYLPLLLFQQSKTRSPKFLLKQLNYIYQQIVSLYFNMHFIQNQMQNYYQFLMFLAMSYYNSNFVLYFYFNQFKKIFSIPILNFLIFLFKESSNYLLISRFTYYLRLPVINLFKQ